MVVFMNIMRVHKHHIVDNFALYCKTLNLTFLHVIIELFSE